MTTVTTITLKDLRKKLKPLGFKVKTKSYSFGIAGTIHRISDGTEKPSMFMSEDHRQEWKPAIEAVTGIIVVNDHNERISGPWSSLK